MSTSISLKTLIKRSDFLRVQAAEKIVTTSMVVHFMAMPEQPARIGYTVTKRCGGAVERNRIKRRLRAAVREVMADTLVQGVDMVLVGRISTQNAPYADLVRDLRYAVKRMSKTSMQPNMTL